ncbi:MAG: insulinase family protein [Clostridia bacterium]|nr:insulinase family protein [Clostridia bacterium]
MAELKKYENGLSLIVLEEPALSVTFAIMVGTGCINETEKTNGISHYIEHVNFKGTKNLTSFDISNKLEFLGSQYNAYTSMDTTCYHAQALPENTEKTFAIMSDMVFNSTYLDEETAKEKGVIVEEINMSEDMPDDVCRELIANAYYGNDGYGRSILGTKENVLSFTKQDVLNYLNDNYVASNIVITFGGKITMSEAEKLVEKYVLPFVKTGAKKPVPKHNVENKKQFLCKNKEIEQSHLFLAFPSHNILDENKITSDIADSILGSGMSSRLFMKVREELGLAYSVYSMCARYVDTGTLNIYAGVSNENAELCFNAIMETILEAQKGITNDEFEKVRNQLKAGSMFSQERSAVKVRLYAKYYLLTGELYNFDEKIKIIDTITKDKVQDALNALDFKNMSTAIVGNGVKPLKI